MNASTPPGMSSAASDPPRRRRGVAMLLVMLGLVVCSILIAGFLSTQGTSIGIARNERDAETARNYAQSGIDMCYWLIVNRSDWRTSMTPGSWLTNYPIGSGTVSVSAADGDNTGNFADDPTQPVILASTGTCNGRSFTLSASISPTGGGTVFRGGSFTLGQLILHNTAAIDSFDSSVAPYSILFPGSNALFASNYSGSGALTMDGLSVFRGSFIGGPNSVIGNLVSAVLGLLIPTSVSAAPQNYIPGHVIPPNTTGLTSNAAKVISSATTLYPGQYPSVSNSKNMTLASGVYRITGNLTSTAAIVVPDGVNATMEIDGTAGLNGGITIYGAGQLTLYLGGTGTISGTISVAGGAANLKILGLLTAANLTLQGTGTSMTGVVFAPQTSVYLTDSAKLFGSVVAHDITSDKTSAIHYDENTKNIRLDNITGGSAPAGTADYVITRLGAS